MDVNLTTLENTLTGRVEGLDSSWKLGAALQALEGDDSASIPFMVRLLENPSSCLALPGSIDLYRHDCLHLLLGKGFSLDDEAYVVGFTMGNDPATNWLHLAIFRFCSWLLYPKPYRFSWRHFRAFREGVALGRSLPVTHLNRHDFRSREEQTLASLRAAFGLG
jgi:hypothetical protein